MFGRVFLLLAIFQSFCLEACLISRSSSPEGVFIFRNFDFPLGGEDGFGQIVLNPRHYKRASFARRKRDRPIRWEAKFASLTFNLLAEHFSQGGINEKGLAVQVAVLRNQFHEDSEDDSLETISELELVQYILDQASSTEEALALFLGENGEQKLRLTTIMHQVSEQPIRELNLHWAICDSKGVAAELEFIRTKFTARLKQPEELFIVTNNNTESLALEYERLVSQSLPIAQNLVTRDSFPRYANARYLLEGKEVLREGLFDLLDSSTEKSWNRWQTVFDLSKKKVYFRSRVNLKLKSFNLADIDFSSLKQVLSMDMHSDVEGLLDLSSFNPVDKDRQARQVTEATVLMQEAIELPSAIHTFIDKLYLINDSSYLEAVDFSTSFEEEKPSLTYPSKIQLAFYKFRIACRVIVKSFMRK